jgi:hypothetical protein
MRGGTISLISARANTGSCLVKSRNHMKNQPNEPMRKPMSTQLGM